MRCTILIRLLQSLCHQDAISGWDDFLIALAKRYGDFEASITPDHWHMLGEA